MAPSLLRRVSTARSLWLFLLVILPLFVSPGTAWGWTWAGFTGEDWREVSEEERALTKPRIDPEAGAEVLFREVDLNDADHRGTRYRNYVRIKLFDQRGVERMSVVEFADARPDYVSFSGRVIKPDGSILPIDKDTVFTREVVRYGDLRARMSSFSPPGLEPGCIIDFRWEYETKESAPAILFLMAAEHPTHVLRLRYKPAHDFRMAHSHVEDVDIKPQGGGYWDVEVRDIPPIPKEPFLPPYYEIQPWMSLSYVADGDKAEAERYWKEISRLLFKVEKMHASKGRGAFKRKASELTVNAPSERESLRRIYDFCAHDIVRLSSSTHELTIPEWQKLKPNEYAIHVLKNGHGTRWQISNLFYSLAHAAGFECHLIFVSNRAYVDWQPDSLTYQSTPDVLVAVRMDGEWEYFDPGQAFIPFGKQDWTNTSATAIIPNPKRAEYWRIPVQPPEYSLLERKADLRIDEEGTLRGSISLRHTGHRAVGVKRHYEGKGTAEYENILMEEVRERLPSAVLSNIGFQNLEDRELDAIISFDIEVVGYADVTPERVFLKTSFFQQGVDPIFLKEEREFGIRFPYAWETRDSVVISYPETYVLEERAAPESVSDLETFYHSALLGLAKTGHRLIFKRTERVAALHVNKELYPAVKGFFDAVHEQDQHILVLRKVEGDGEAPLEGDGITKPAAPEEAERIPVSAE